MATRYVGVSRVVVDPEKFAGILRPLEKGY
jgi:hypothetical protein